MAFYVPSGGGYDASEHTRGPWDPDAQHAGPPCALLGRALDRAGELAEARVARLTFEILGPVPIGRMEPRARVIRPGRSVELIEGTLACEGRDVIGARAWRIRTAAVSDSAPPATEAMPAPEDGRPVPFFPTGQAAGYHTAMEARFASGEYVTAGPARAWLRMKVPLIESEAPSPLDRVLVAADSGNGVSSPLDYERFVFINADLSVALHRLPQGDWVGLDATTVAQPDGIGLTDTVLHDARGPIGRGTQSLLVANRA